MPDFVFIKDMNLSYTAPPYNPPERYLESGDVFNEFDKTNNIYDSVRKLFIKMGLDSENIGTAKWNPFRGLIKDNYKIVIKPNMVLDERGKNVGKKCITTQADIIRPILDYIYLLKISERINVEVRICDVPIQGADFEKIIQQNGLKELVEFYNKNFDLDVQILDLRDLIAKEDEYHFLYQKKVKGDPSGYTIIHLKESCLNDIVKDYKKFGVSGYGFDNTSDKHSKEGFHYYHIPNTILNSDLFINVPKLKTHKKAGITIALKNLIGIVGDKSWIPHFRRGSIKSGGDEYDDNKIFLKRITTSASYYLQGKSKVIWNIARGFNEKVVKKYFREDYTKKELSDYERKEKFLVNGDWYGNDTIWRPILDLNYILRYADKKGEIRTDIQRKYICLTDGIISGEGDGPLEPDARNAGILSLSFNPLINDICLSRIMGFDREKIPQISKGKEFNEKFNFDNDTDKIEIIGSDKDVNGDDKFVKIKFNNLPNLNFLPPPGWKGHIELKNE
jgi:uncharacterized protein (DUF362 family)